MHFKVNFVWSLTCSQTTPVSLQSVNRGLQIWSTDYQYQLMKCAKAKVDPIYFWSMRNQCSVRGPQSAVRTLPLPHAYMAGPIIQPRLLHAKENCCLSSNNHSYPNNCTRISLWNVTSFIFLTLVEKIRQHIRNMEVFLPKKTTSCNLVAILFFLPTARYGVKMWIFSCLYFMYQRRKLSKTSRFDSTLWHILIRKNARVEQKHFYRAYFATEKVVFKKWNSVLRLN